MVERLSQYATTRKQKDFEWDFTAGVEDYEVWEEIQVGESSTGARVFRVEAEDIISFSTSALESDPMLVDVDYAQERGGLIAHPLFVVQVVFYCVDRGFGSWIRSPGARNPGQRIEFNEPFRIGERITATITHWDKWIRRDKHYLEDRVELRNEHGELKATWYVRLIVPETRAELVRFANL